MMITIRECREKRMTVREVQKRIAFLQHCIDIFGDPRSDNVIRYQAELDALLEAMEEAGESPQE